MTLEINVDETMFKDILEKELGAFTKEELHEILKGCIIEFFNTNDNIKKMFLQEKTSYWGGQTHNEGYEPTGLLRDIVKEKFDYNEPYKEVREKLIEFCSKNDTLKKLLKEMIADSFMSVFTNNLFWNGAVRQNIANIVKETIVSEKDNLLR